MGNIYIALDVDQIFVWNTESQSYVQQSWDAYIIQQLQTNIASAQMAFQNLQNSKLDKPNLSINNIPYWHQSGTFFNSNMSYINGNIGINLSGAATEKLEVGGRIKSDGQVFNETSSAILPKEIKFKDGKFKAALADGVEKSIAFEGETVSNLISEFVYNGNKEIFFSSFNYSTGIGTTTTPHGLPIGVKRSYGILVPNSFKNFVTDDSKRTQLISDILSIPYEYKRTVIAFIPIDANTIQVTDWWSTGAIAVNLSSAENAQVNNSNIGWHLEEAIEAVSGFTIFDNLPRDLTSILIEIFWCSSYGHGPASRSLQKFHYSSNYSIYENNVSVLGKFGNGIALNEGINRQNNNNESIVSKSTIEVLGSDIGELIRYNEMIFYRPASSSSVVSANYTYQDLLMTKKNKGIARIKHSPGQNICFANGTTFRLLKN